MCERDSIDCRLPRDSDAKGNAAKCLPISITVSLPIRHNLHTNDNAQQSQKYPRTNDRNPPKLPPTDHNPSLDAHSPLLPVKAPRAFDGNQNACNDEQRRERFTGGVEGLELRIRRSSLQAEELGAGYTEVCEGEGGAEIGEEGAFKG
jgi:hypothetical protein